MSAPTLAPATITTDDDGGLTVAVRWVPQDGLDRLDCAAWALGRGHRQLAQRLVAAIAAGAVVVPTEPYTDVNGARGWHHRSTVLARKMNADLNRLGF